MCDTLRINCRRPLNNLSMTEDTLINRVVMITADFKLNVLTLDDLVPADLGFTDEAPGTKVSRDSR